MRNQRLRLILAFVLALAMLIPSFGLLRADGGETPYWELLDSVSDSSDLPTWTGKQLNLVLWNAHGTGNSTREKAAIANVTGDEFKRVTGITLDYENSFDNGGQDFNYRLGMLAAANDWPDVMLEWPGHTELAESGNLYDLSEYLPLYAPRVVEAYSSPLMKTVWEDISITGGMEGKVFAIPACVQTTWVTRVFPEVDPIRYADIWARKDPSGDYGYFLVRDDILQMLYPDALTQQDIENIYMEQGYFTEEQIYDIPINSREDFFDFLYAVKELNIMEGNRPVEVIATHQGQDNWAISCILEGLISGQNEETGYFMYYDGETKQVEYMFQQPELKEQLRTWNKLVRDGVASKEALLDTHGTYMEKLNNGLYAVTYAWLRPDKALLAEQGKGYQYRKVFPKIAMNTDKYPFFEGTPSVHQKLSVFTKSVSEEELIQILRAVDYLFSDVGEKMVAWGPRTAGLFEDDESGRRAFTNKEMEAQVIYGEVGTLYKDYNLGFGQWPGFASHRAMSYINTPMYVYDVERAPGRAERYYSAGMVTGVDKIAGRAPFIWSFFDKVAETQRFWDARVEYEDAFKKCFTAASDEEFEQFYAEMVRVAESNGLTAETLEEINRVWREDINVDFLQFLPE